MAANKEVLQRLDLKILQQIEEFFDRYFPKNFNLYLVDKMFRVSARKEDRAIFIKRIEECSLIKISNDQLSVNNVKWLRINQSFLDGIIADNIKNRGDDVFNDLNVLKGLKALVNPDFVYQLRLKDLIVDFERSYTNSTELIYNEQSKQIERDACTYLMKMQNCPMYAEIRIKTPIDNLLDKTVRYNLEKLEIELVIERMNREKAAAKKGLVLWLLEIRNIRNKNKFLGNFSKKDSQNTNSLGEKETVDIKIKKDISQKKGAMQRLLSKKHSLEKNTLARPVKKDHQNLQPSSLNVLANSTIFDHNLLKMIFSYQAVLETPFLDAPIVHVQEPNKAAIKPPIDKGDKKSVLKK